MGTRRKARQLALQLLYQIDITGDISGESQEKFWGHFQASPAVREFSSFLVQGVLSHVEEIDSTLSACSEHWRVGRMGKVDLSILRMAAFELLHCPQIPKNVTINEAIEMAKLYVGEESGTFVNGVLDQLASRVDSRDSSAQPDSSVR
jgi:N utilization substance protein B